MINTITFEGIEIVPSKVVCVGRNYADHISELGNETPTEPVIFLKPNSSISKEIYTHDTDEIHYEGEISFLIRGGVIAGVGFGLDLTKRAVQSKLKEQGLPWERSKAFDNSAVFSDFVNVDKGISDLRLELFINSELRQSGGCELMLNTPETLLKEISSFMTLADGDIIMSGTPKGVGVVNEGDLFLGKIIDKDKTLIERSWTVK